MGEIIEHNGWTKKFVSEIGKVIRGSSPRPKGDPRYYGGNVPRLMGRDVSRDGKYVTPKIDFLTEEGSKKSRPCPKGTLTIVCSGEVGTPSFLAVDACIHDGFLAIIDIDENTVDKDYLYYNIYRLKDKLERSATHGGIFTNLTTTILNEQILVLPSHLEQKKIASILSTWDQAIEKTQKINEQLELRKKGLMQELLSGKKRLPGFDGEWKKYEIAEIASQFTDKNSDNKISEVLSCTKYDGLVRSLEYFGRKVYGDDLSKYKVVPRNYFAYATNHIEEGSIGYQDLMDAGLVSPMYTVFKTNSKVDDSYLFRLLKTDRMIYHYQSNMSGSVARRGGLRWNTFKELIVKLPGIDEQKAIASLLDEADNELNLQSEHLDSLKSQKKGLMQQLLTGKKRVHE